MMTMKDFNTAVNDNDDSTSKLIKTRRIFEGKGVFYLTRRKVWLLLWPTLEGLLHQQLLCRIVPFQFLNFLHVWTLEKNPRAHSLS